MRNPLKIYAATAAAALLSIPLFSGQAQAEGEIAPIAVEPDTAALAETLSGTAPGGIDMGAIEQTASNTSLSSFIASAQECAMPILVLAVVIAAFCAIGGLAFKPLRAAAGGILATGLVFFILVNYPEQIVGIIISIGDGIVKIISGG